MDDNECKFPECGCQRYLSKDGLDECKHCGHSIGFHEFENVNTSEYPYGLCKKSECACQRFKQRMQDCLDCLYCSHSSGFHKKWKSKPSAKNIRRSVGRPTANSLTINHLICFDKVLSNKIPKQGTKAWNKLKSKKLIKEGIKISQMDTQEEIHKIIHDLFGLSSDQYRLYSVKLGKPTVVNEELSFDSIRDNLTKANKKLYIGPSKHDIVDMSIEERVINLPPQSSNDPTVHGFFNGEALLNKSHESPPGTDVINGALPDKSHELPPKPVINGALPKTDVIDNLFKTCTTLYDEVEVEQ